MTGRNQFTAGSRSKISHNTETTRRAVPPNQSERAVGQSESTRTRTSKSLSRRALLTVATGAIGALAGCNVPFLGQSPPECSGQQITDLSAPRSGPANTPVSVGIYTDFACPHCRDFFLNVYPAVRKRIPQETAHFVHHDFLLPVSKWSYPVASAAREVQRAHSDREFWTFAKLAYQNQNEYSFDVLEQIARKVTSDPQAVRRAGEQLPYCQLLKRERERGANRGVEGTPTVFVNERKLEAPSTNELVDAITNAND